MKRILGATLVAFALIAMNHLAWAGGTSSEGKIARPGFDLYYRLFGLGRPLVVLSGGPGFDCDYLEPVARELASSHQTILVELRGTGRSRPAEINRQTVNLELCLADLEALRESLKFERWSVLGHSAGANLAMNYAIAFPGRVQALVLVDSGPVRQSLVGAMMDNVFLRLTPEQAAAAKRTPSFQTLLPGYFYNRDAAANMVATFRPESYHEDVGQLMAADEMAPGMDLRSALERLSLPALVVAGRQDPIDPEMQEDIHLALKNSRLVLLDRCGHFSWLEQPAALFGAIREFLTALGL
ncbi:MAG: alpha/beta hydrolase [Terriglobia bacterium]